MHLTAFFFDLCLHQPHYIGKYNLNTPKGLSAQLIYILQKSLLSNFCARQKLFELKEQVKRLVHSPIFVQFELVLVNERDRQWQEHYFIGKVLESKYHNMLSTSLYAALPLSFPLTTIYKMSQLRVSSSFSLVTCSILFTTRHFQSKTNHSRVLFVIIRFGNYTIIWLRFQHLHPTSRPVPYCRYIPLYITLLPHYVLSDFSNLHEAICHLSWKMAITDMFAL